MSKKMEKIAQVKAYRNYAEKVEIHQEAIKGCKIHFGAHANLAEMEIKLAMNNYRFKGVAKPGVTDTKKKVDGKLCNFQIKTGEGEIANIVTDEFKLMGRKRLPPEVRNHLFDITPKNGNIFEADYVVYCPTFDLEFPIEYQSYVLTGSDFEYVLKTLGLIKYKRTKSACDRGLDHYDRFGIHDFRSSEKREEEFLDMLEEYGTSLDIWIEEHIIESVEE